MQKELLKKYVILNDKINNLEEQKQTLKKSIIEGMKAEKTEKMETSFGIFTVASRAVWKYSKKVLAMEEKVKIAKTVEQEKGTAKKSITEYLLFTAPKEN